MEYFLLEQMAILNSPAIPPEAEFLFGEEFCLDLMCLPSQLMNKRICYIHE